MPLPRTHHVDIETPDSAGTDSAPGAKPEPEAFSREYVKELREESARYRTRAQDAEARAKTAEERAARAADQAAEAEARARAGDERFLMAELRTVAARAGMIDLDGLKLADLSAISLNGQGQVEGAEALMASMKQAKPYLFRATASLSTSSTQAPPPREKPQVKTAAEMSGAEWQAKKKELGL